MKFELLMLSEFELNGWILIFNIRVACLWCLFSDKVCKREPCNNELAVLSHIIII